MDDAVRELPWPFRLVLAIAVLSTVAGLKYTGDVAAVRRFEFARIGHARSFTHPFTPTLMPLTEEGPSCVIVTPTTPTTAADLL